jgi:hypothetical protein
VLTRQLSEAIKRSAVPTLTQSVSNRQVHVPIVNDRQQNIPETNQEVDPDPYDPSQWKDVYTNSPDTKKKPVRRNQYGDIVE